MDPDMIKTGMLFAALIVLVGAVAKMWSFERGLAERIGLLLQSAGKPQNVAIQSPLVVTPEERFATKEEIDEIRDRLGGIEHKIETLVDDLRGQADVQLGKVHDRINDLLGAVSELRGELKRIHFSRA